MPTSVLPFQTRLTHFRLPDGPCQLPFAIGSATQHNPSSSLECNNCQDSARIIIAKDHLIAVIADGCSGTHPTLEATCHSSNEVGAKLYTYLASSTLHRLMGLEPELPDDLLLQTLTKTIRDSTTGLLQNFCGEDQTLRELFAFDFLTTTMICAVVTASRFLVFHCGNGVVAVNGEVTILDGDDGIYMTKEIGADTDGGSAIPMAFKVYRAGRTSELNSVFLATDGLAQVAAKNSSDLNRFAGAEPPAEQVENGFDYLLQEFRGSIAWNQSVNLALHDDGTFVVLRRVLPKAE